MDKTIVLIEGKIFPSIYISKISQLSEYQSKVLQALYRWKMEDCGGIMINNHIKELIKILISIFQGGDWAYEEKQINKVLEIAEIYGIEFDEDGNIKEENYERKNKENN